MLQSGTQKPRRGKGSMNSLATNFLHLRNPYTIAWWSAAFPGFGHISMGNYVSGFLLFFWEMVANTKAKANLAILYSFTGRIELAKDIVDNRWLLLYAPVFIFSIWDSYRLALQMNQLSLLADRGGRAVPQESISFMEINVLDKRSPWVAVVWTLLLPGLGHIYTHRIPTGFFLLIWWIAIAYYSFLLPATQFTAMGEFEQAKNILDPEWIMFLPSIYGFGAYDAYVNTIEYNRLFEKEQASYFRQKYQSPDFHMPTKVASEMYITASFEHSIKIELAISELEQKGISQDNIFIIPMNTPRKEQHLFDTMHRSDGMSMFDLPTALGTIFMLFGVMWGFNWAWGPILCGLIGLFLGGILGFIFKYFYYRMYSQKRTPGKVTEVVVMVSCQRSEREVVEQVLTQHLALGIGCSE